MVTQTAGSGQEALELAALISLLLSGKEGEVKGDPAGEPMPDDAANWWAMALMALGAPSLARKRRYLSPR